MKLEFKAFVGGVQARHDFENGYGVSVVKYCLSYGISSGLYELAVMQDGDLCYETEITDDVIGNLTIEQAEEIAERVANLQRAND